MVFAEREQEMKEQLFEAVVIVSLVIASIIVICDYVA
jgi:hypothetical protein